jgi:hypothetical protein
MKRLLLVLLLACCACGGLFGQSASASATTASSGAVTPEPYKASEFPGWALDLRRFEIVSIGAFPFVIFVASETFDLCRFCFGKSYGLTLSKIGTENPFVVTSVTAGDGIYAPWPVKSSSSYSTTGDEKALTIVVAAVLAIGVGVADYLIVKAQERANLRRKAAMRSEAPPAGSDAKAAEPGESGDGAPSGGGDDGSTRSTDPNSPDAAAVQP